MESNISISSKTVLSSFIWKMLERIFNHGSSLVVQIVLARILLPSDFGNLALMLAVINYLSFFVHAGLSATIIQKKDLSQLDINTLFTISISVASIIYVILYFYAPYLALFYDKTELTLPLRITASILFLHSINSIQIGILSRQMHFRTIFIRQSLVVPIAGGIGILMAYYGYGLWSLITYTVLNLLLAVVFFFINTNLRLKFQFSKESAISLYSFCIKIIGANIVSGFGDLIRTVSIGKKYTTSDLAFYDRAYNYSLLVLQIINNSVQSVLLPVFSREQDDHIRLKNIARKSLGVSVFFIIPFLCGMIVIAKPLVILLLTEKWLPCVPFFMLFLLFRLAGCIVGIDKQVYMALGKSLVLFYFECFLLLANVIMLIITIPISVKAIAIGAIIVEYLFSFFLILVSKKIILYSLRERFHDLVRPVLNSVIMMVGMWSLTLLDINDIYLIMLQCSLGIFIYFVMANITKDENFTYLIYMLEKKNRSIKKPFL